MRQKTRAPGSTRARLFQFGFAVESKKTHAGFIGKGDVALFLIVLPKDSRSAPAPLSRHSSISARLATSKFEQCCEASRHDLGRRVRLHRVIDAGDRQVTAQLLEASPITVGIDDQARGLRGIFGQKTSDSLGGSFRAVLPDKRGKRNRSTHRRERVDSQKQGSATYDRGEPNYRLTRPKRGRAEVFVRLA